MLGEAGLDQVGDAFLGGDVGVGDQVAEPFVTDLAWPQPLLAQQVAGLQGGFQGGLVNGVQVGHRVILWASGR